MARASACWCAQFFVFLVCINANFVCYTVDRHNYLLPQIADTENHRVVAINKRTLHVEWQFGRTGLSGKTNELLNFPSGVALSADCMRVFVADAANSRIMMLSALDGAFLLAYGSLGSGDGQFTCPVALAISARNVLYVADANAHCVHCLSVRQGARTAHIYSMCILRSSA